MSYRIELTFVGEAPADELERAKIMAAVADEVGAMSAKLAEAGFANTVVAHTVRATDRKPRAIHGRLAAE